MAETLPPNVPRTVKHYRLIRPLGAGGMGAVFEGEDRRDRSRVAVKLLHSHLADDPGFRIRFEQEAHVAALLRSPYTVQLLDYGHEGGLFFLVMEYIDGRSLSSVIAEQPVPPARAMRIASEIARALEEAEARGVVHRDVKPENILIDSDERVKVADFGIARRVGGGSLTEVGGFVGSVLFASPEQVRGESDRRSDIYAIGTVLYAMLAGHPPFNGTALDVMRQHADASFPAGPLRDMPDAVVNIVRRCMEKDPQDRYQSASELAGSLERANRSVQMWEQRRAAEAQAAQPPPAPPPSTPPVTRLEPVQPEAIAGTPPPLPAETAPPVNVPGRGIVPGPIPATRVEESPPPATRAAPPEAAKLVPPATLASTPSETIAQQAGPTVARPPEPLAGALPERRTPEATVAAVLSHPTAQSTADSRPPDFAATAAPSTPRSGSGGRKWLAVALGAVLLASVGVAAWFLWPKPEDEAISGAVLVASLDDLGADSFSTEGSASARTVRPPLAAREEGALDSVRITSTVDGVTRAVEFVVFVSATAAREYWGDVTEEAGAGGDPPCVSEFDLPDAPLVGLTTTCYQREGDVVLIASVPPPAGEEEARGLLERAVEVLNSIRGEETPKRATPVLQRTPGVTTPTSPSPSASPAVSPSPTSTATKAPPPTPTVVPIPISSGVWNYDFGVTRNTCPFGPAVGERVVAAYRFAEITAGDGLISPGEQVDVTQEATQFYVGRFTFTFPTFEFTYPVSAANQSGTARVSNVYTDANNGTATLLETYALSGGATCTFFSAE